MVRDLDLIRAILMDLEKAPFRHGWIDLEVDDYSAEQVSYHVMLLADSGYIEAVNLTTHDDPWPNWKPSRLTAQGHDFLDAIRSDTIMKKVKDRLRSEAVSAPLSVVKSLAVKFVEELLLT